MCSCDAEVCAAGTEACAAKAEACAANAEACAADVIDPQCSMSDLIDIGYVVRLVTLLPVVPRHLVFPRVGRVGP